MREAGLIAIILALCVLMSFASPHFLTLGNFRAMLMSFSVEGIVVVGMTILLIVGVSTSRSGRSSASRWSCPGRCS